MELNVQINPDDINKMVAEAVLKSAIGEQLKIAIERKIKELDSTSYLKDNPIGLVVNSHIQDIVRQILIGTYAEEIRERVQKAVAARISDDFIGKVIETGLKNW